MIQNDLTLIMMKIDP